MIKNRYHKTTMGMFAELAIAAQLDASDGTAIGGTPSVISVPVTIAADPTPGDTITINIDGQDYLHTVPVGDETTQQAHDAILALLTANTQGFVVSTHSGTTSSVYQLAWAGADKNGKTVTLSETGSTFTVAGPYTFAGGVNADATAADNLKDFVANALAGSIWAFWDDDNTALRPGDTALAANINRKYFYAWKQGVATEYNKSTSIPIKDLTKDTIAYNAGSAQVSTLTGTGTYSAGQILHVRIINTTPTQLPYESFSYSTPIVSTIDAAFTAVAALINAEAADNSPVATASAATNVLTMTATNKYSTFKVAVELEVTPAQPSDLSVFAFATTTKQKPPIGDIASVTELEKYYKMNNGGLAYGVDQPTVTKEDFGQPTTNVGLNSVTQYGFLLVSNKRTEDGVVRNYNNTNRMLIAIKNTDLTALAAL